MRLIETLLLLANLLAFFIVAIPLPRAVCWVRYWVPIVPLIAIAQVLVEGPRWQMIPAYVLTGLLLLVWLLRIVKRGSLDSNRLIAGLGSGLGVLMLVISIALPILVPIFHFPKPTGSYAIGTLTYHWVDSSRPELFTTDPNDHRELMAQVWYPAKNELAAARAPYIQDADVVTPALARLTHLPGFLFTHFKYVTTNAVVAASIADDTSRYPVLIYLTGLDGFRAVSTFQIEELVSYGYIVVGLDQPGAVAMVRLPDGRQISGLPKDEIQPLIDQSIEQQPTTPTLNGITLSNGIIPYFAQDVRFTLRLERQRSGGWTEKDIALTLSTMRMVYKELPGDGYYIEIPTMFHVNFTDLPNWSPITSQLGLTGPINGQRAHDIINAYSLAFFDKHLKGQPSTLLDRPAAQYPDVLFETRQP